MNPNDPDTKKWFRITETENIPLREGRAVEIAGHDIAIFNLGDRFLAVENKCPHRGGPLADGIVSGRTVVCPLHAWKIDLECGQVTNRPEENPCVKTFATTVHDGVVMLEVTISDEHMALHLPCVAHPTPRLPEMSAGD